MICSAHVPLLCKRKERCSNLRDSKVKRMLSTGRPFSCRAAFDGTSERAWEIMNGMSKEDLTAFDPQGNTVRFPVIQI